MAFIFFFIFILVIELPSINLAALRLQAGKPDRNLSTPLHIDSPGTTHLDIIISDVPGSVQSEQTLLKQTVPEPSYRLGQHTSKSGKVIQNKFSARETPVSVPERISTSQRLLVNQENASQRTTHISDEYRIRTTRVINSTIAHQNTTAGSMRSIYKTPSFQTVTNQNKVSENILSHRESTPSIKSENVMFRNVASRSSAVQDVASVTSSTTRDMKKSQGRTSQGSSVKSSMAPQTAARRQNINEDLVDLEKKFIEERNARNSHTMSTFPFYPDGKVPVDEEIPIIEEKCEIGQCLQVVWQKPKKPDDPLRNLNQNEEKTTTEDDSVFPEQYF